MKTSSSIFIVALVQLQMLDQGSHLEVQLRPLNKSQEKLHFNLKAPTTLKNLTEEKVFSPQHVGKNQICFRIPRPKPGQFQISTFLCNHQGTLCQKSTETFRWPPAP